MKIRKMMTVLMATTLVAGCFWGCGSSSKSGDSSSDSKELNICVWDGTFSEDAISKFEKDNDCTVNVTYIDNTDTLISKLVEGSGEYDVCDIEAAYVKTFVDNGLLQKIDHSAIQNEEYVDDSLMKTGAVGDEKMEYTTPDQNAGYTVILYNKETCPMEITSFKDLTNPKLKGQIAMVNSTISLYGAALEALGYKADSKDEKEIKEANDLLTEIKGNVKTFVGESAVSALENGECSVALCWDYATLCADSEENWDKFAVADIDSDYEKFLQYWGITSTSEKTELATKFINYMISPEAVAMHMKDWGGVPMVKEEYIKDLLPEGYYDNPSIAKYEELADKSWMVAVSDDQISIMDTYYTLLMGQ
ncbi:MAG: extracellular solute-binding protein [Pararoseburia sp.]|nr:extracellular solute-binding protein [Pararoseburia sp.]